MTVSACTADYGYEERIPRGGDRFGEHTGYSYEPSQGMR